MAVNAKALEEKQSIHPMMPSPGSFGQRLKPESCKWTDVRHNKVELMRERFKERPETVLVLKDTKFENEHLAILKKSVFEEILKLNADLKSGEAAIKQSVEGVVSAVNTLIAAVVEDQEVLSKNQILKHAIKSVQVQINGIVKSSVVFTNPPEDKGSISLSEEEKANFEDLTSNEED